MNIKIVEVSPQLLPQVVELADNNSNTLGFLPKQAFSEHAARRLILCAVDHDTNLVGYLLYRYVRRENKATIVHLCIDEKFRGNNIAELLFDRLKEKTSSYYGIGLLCRRDYEHANKLWKKLGFRHKDEKRGRGKQDTRLIFWWYDHGHKTLFDYAANEKIQVVIDANIFFDFQNSKQATSEALALNADWLREAIELKVTPELSIEINRQSNHLIREKHLKQANDFLVAQDTESNFSAICNQLRNIFPSPKNSNDESDLNHVAWAIADREVGFFVTQDINLLGLSPEIYEKYGLSILNPTDLILQIDEYIRIDEYTHMRFAGTHLTYRRVQAKEEQRLIEFFQYHEEQENQVKFLSAIRPYLIERDNYSSYVVEDTNKNLLVLIVFDRTNTNELIIPLFRINRKIPDKQIVRYLILKFLAIAAEERRDFTRITEPRLHDIMRKALQEDTFVPSAKSLLKLNIALVDKSSNIANYIKDKLSLVKDAEPYYRMQIAHLQNPESIKNVEVMSEIERQFWPVKIIDTNIMTISMPINPDWAYRWFDEKLAVQTLFGAEQERAFNREGIYYSRKALKSVTFPARIIWYVNKDERVANTESIRACSRLEDVIIGSARDIFRQFQHLGIYEWKNIENLTGNNPDKEIAAYRFSDTQLFTNHVPYKKWEELTQKSLGKAPNRQSPASVPNDIFAEIYKIGMGLP